MSEKLMVVYLQPNRLILQMGEDKVFEQQAFFSHPRSLIGDFAALNDCFGKLLAQSEHRVHLWQKFHTVQQLLWVLPPQVGGVMFLERRALRELGWSVLSGRVCMYVTESSVLNYAHHQATIPTLVRI